MKPYLMLLLVLSSLVHLNCGRSGNRANDPGAAADTRAVGNNGPDLPQHGDYSTLFNATADNCPLLTVTEVENALSLPAGSVELQANPCRYIITLADGSKSPLGIRPGTLVGTSSASAIESFLKDDTGILSAKISDTGDNYICIHRARSSLAIYNTNFDTSINMDFATMVFAAAHKKEQITVTPSKTVRENAVTLANYLLKKYKK